MSTHRRAWKQRAGVVVALVVGALLAVPATPAQAAPNVTNVSASPGSVEAGKTTKISYTLTFEDGADPADVSVSSSNSKLSCVDGCARGNVDSSGTFEATFRLADDAGNGTARITVKATDSNGPLRQSKEGSTTVTLVGKPAAPQTVRSVSGKVVKQADGSAVPNATVMLQDGNGKRIDTISDDSGNFRFTGSTEKPIAPGRLALGASFDNVVATKSFNASAGQSITGQRLSLAIKVEVTPSATPSASEEPLPTDEATDETTEETPEATAGAANNASNSDGGGMGSYLIILLGGLLVAAGVGTIVLLWMKRRENADDTDGAAPAGAAAAGAVPAARGGYRGGDDQTRVVNGVGAGPDRTMVAGGSLADAPTMMHRPVVDDVPPDPYGAPPQPSGGGSPQSGWAGTGYGDEPAGPGGYGGGYGNAPSSGGGYGNAPSSGGGYGNAPSSGGGYGSRDYGAPAGGAAGYPPPAPGGAGYGERYDEPTGRYTGEATQYPAPADPYATGTYQPEQGGYGQPDPAPYGRGGEPTGGYDQGGYGQPDAAPYGRGAEPTGGYDQGGGYGQQGGYGQEPPTQRGGGYDNGYDQGGGHGQQNGYGQEPPAQRGGGYDQGGYYGDQPQGGRGRPDGPPPQDRGGRRLDWLDD